MRVSLSLAVFPRLIVNQVTYEMQPPSYTSLKLLTGPPRGGGGDTLWSSQYAAYDAMSSPMQTYLEGLTALHSAELQADGSRALERPVRREPIITEHPIIRTHPVTGWKSLFFNPGFVKAIVGIPKTESDAIIRYLNEVITTTQEFHVRFQWRKDDVAFWDNRICVSWMPHHGRPPVLILSRITPRLMGLRPIGATQSGLHATLSVLCLIRMGVLKRTSSMLDMACRRRRRTDHANQTTTIEQ